jgi:hypothetical protein
LQDFPERLNRILTDHYSQTATSLASNTVTAAA